MRGRRLRRRSLSFTAGGDRSFDVDDPVRRSSAPEHSQDSFLTSPTSTHIEDTAVVGVASVSNHEFLELQGRCYPSQGVQRRCSLQLSLFSPITSEGVDTVRATCAADSVDMPEVPTRVATRAKSVTLEQHPSSVSDVTRRRCHSISGETLVHLLKECNSPYAPASKRCRRARETSPPCIPFEESSVAFYVGDSGSTDSVYAASVPQLSALEDTGSTELFERESPTQSPDRESRHTEHFSVVAGDDGTGGVTHGPEQSAAGALLLAPGPNVRGDCQQHCVLPTTNTHHHFSPIIRLVTPETVHRLLSNEFHEHVSEFIIVDCRFPFEYDGGHIKTAVNQWNAELAINAFFAHPVVTAGNGGRTVVLFHCEFSSHRAPTMFCNLRRMDAHITAGAKGLLFPEFYLIEGGYSVFFDKYPQHCTPQSYTVRSLPSLFMVDTIVVEQRTRRPCPS